MTKKITKDDIRKQVVVEYINDYNSFKYGVVSITLRRASHELYQLAFKISVDGTILLSETRILTDLRLYNDFIEEELIKLSDTLLEEGLYTLQ